MFKITSGIIPIKDLNPGSINALSCVIFKGDDVEDGKLNGKAIGMSFSLLGLEFEHWVNNLLKEKKIKDITAIDSDDLEAAFLDLSLHMFRLRVSSAMTRQGYNGYACWRQHLVSNIGSSDTLKTDSHLEEASGLSGFPLIVGADADWISSALNIGVKPLDHMIADGTLRVGIGLSKDLSTLASKGLSGAFVCKHSSITQTEEVVVPLYGYRFVYLNHEFDQFKDVGGENDFPVLKDVPRSYWPYNTSKGFKSIQTQVYLDGEWRHLGSTRFRPPFLRGLRLGDMHLLSAFTVPMDGIISHVSTDTPQAHGLLQHMTSLKHIYNQYAKELEGASLDPNLLSKAKKYVSYVEMDPDVYDASKGDLKGIAPEVTASRVLSNWFGTHIEDSQDGLFRFAARVGFPLAKTVLKSEITFSGNEAKWVRPQSGMYDLRHGGGYDARRRGYYYGGYNVVPWFRSTVSEITSKQAYHFVYMPVAHDNGRVSMGHIAPIYKRLSDNGFGDDVFFLGNPLLPDLIGEVDQDWSGKKKLDNASDWMKNLTQSFCFVEGAMKAFPTLTPPRCADWSHNRGDGVLNPKDAYADDEVSEVGVWYSGLRGFGPALTAHGLSGYPQPCGYSITQVHDMNAEEHPRRDDTQYGVSCLNEYVYYAFMRKDVVLTSLAPDELFLNESLGIYAAFGLLHGAVDIPDELRCGNSASLLLAVPSKTIRGNIPIDIKAYL